MIYGIVSACLINFLSRKAANVILIPNIKGAPKVLYDFWNTLFYVICLKGSCKQISPAIKL